MYFLLDGRLCSMLPLDQFDADGFPLRAVYWYKSSEGLGDVETRSTNSLVRVPSDDGASCDAQTAPHGAHFYVEVSDETAALNLQSIYDRLVHVKNHRDQILSDAQAANVGGGDETRSGRLVRQLPRQLAQPQPRELRRVGRADLQRDDGGVF